MTSDQPSSGKQGARILNFRRAGKRPPAAGPVPDLVRDLAKYERGPDDAGDAAGEYRHRMIVNLAAFLFVIALIAAGFWLADTMARMRKNQDCFLTGRRGRTPVDVAPRDRW